RVRRELAVLRGGLGQATSPDCLHAPSVPLPALSWGLAPIAVRRPLGDAERTTNRRSQMTATAVATEQDGLLAIAAQSMTPTNSALLRALHRRGVPARMMGPRQSLHVDAAAVLVRLDTRPTLDGTQPGFFALRALEAEGVPVLNRSTALFACHDKLATAL